MRRAPILVWLSLVCPILPVVSESLLRPDTRTILYYIQTEDSWESLQANARKISVVAPHVLVVDREGTVRGAVEERVRTLAKDNGIEIMPVLVNADFGAAVARSILTDEARRHRVVSETVRLCQENHCAGLQLDFEGVAQEDSAAYLTLIREISTVLHARKLYLSVAVASPLFSGSRPLAHYKTTYGGFVVTPSMLDLKEIGQSADFLTLMAYDHYGRDAPPGPVAGYPWVEQSIRFFLQYVPAAKISLGIPFYGRRWCWQEVDELSFGAVQTLLQTTKAPVNRHPWQRTPTFEFEKNGCRNVVFYEDRGSLQEKLRLVRKYRLPGFSGWRLGHEDPQFWNDVPIVRRSQDD